ncbi:MAG TPA: hypothetical protein VK522_11430 [Pseudolabrys sp.]|nr:hypothetical protein [Pseudolabrys sp.]
MPAHSETFVTKITFTILFCIALGPVLLTPIPAMVDYPNHLARMYLLSASGTGDANAFYRTAWALYPNLAMDLVIPQIARLASVESATRLFLLLSQILVVGGAMALERVVKGRVQVSGFVAVMFLYCLPFAWGFVNFEFGLGVALWGIAAMLLVQERRWPVRLIVNTVFVAALFAAHFFALGIYGATLGIYELWRAKDSKAEHRETATRLAMLALPAAALLAIMVATAGAIGGEGNAWFFEFKPLWVFRILNGYNLAVSAVSMFVLLILGNLLAKRGFLAIAPAGIWLAIGFGILYVAIPSSLFGTSFVDIRMIVAAAFIMPAFCTLALPDRTWLWRVLGAVAAITLANLAVVYFVWLSYRADYAALIASFAKIEKGATVLSGTTGTGDDPPFNNLTDYPFYYAPTLAVYYAKAFVPNLFAAAGKQPVTVRDDMRHLAVPHGGPVPLPILAGIAAGKTADIVPPYLRNWHRDFQYLYVLGAPAANPMPELLEELDRSSRFVLYKIRRKN